MSSQPKAPPGPSDGRAESLAELASLLTGMEELGARLAHLHSRASQWRDSPLADEILAVQRAMESAGRRLAKAINQARTALLRPLEDRR